jgi:hypothetical protein
MSPKSISESVTKTLRERKEYFVADTCNVYLLDKLPEHLNIQNIINALRQRVPEQLFYGLDAIYIGNYKELEEREVDSVYYAGAIYVKPRQKSDSDLISDIIHEIAHSVEENHSHHFMTTNLQSEFLSKRKQLFKVLSDNGYKCSLKMFMNPNFSEDFDEYLYKDVGYQSIESLAPHLFITPYAATSIREYFANGFEHYFYKCKESGQDIGEIFMYCPKLLSLLRELTI